MGSVHYGSVRHMLLWLELLVWILSFAVADTAQHDIMAFKYRKPPDNYTYIGVAFAVTTLVKCAVFSSHHPSSHNGLMSTEKSASCTCYMSALISTVQAKL